MIKCAGHRSSATINDHQTDVERRNVIPDGDRRNPRRSLSRFLPRIRNNIAGKRSEQDVSDQFCGKRLTIDDAQWVGPDQCDRHQLPARVRRRMLPWVIARRNADRPEPGQSDPDAPATSSIRDRRCTAATVPITHHLVLDPWIKRQGREGYPNLRVCVQPIRGQPVTPDRTSARRASPFPR